MTANNEGHRRRQVGLALGLILFVLFLSFPVIRDQSKIRTETKDGVICVLLKDTVRDENGNVKLDETTGKPIHVSVPVHLTDPETFVKIEHLEGKVLLDEEKKPRTETKDGVVYILLKATVRDDNGQVKLDETTGKPIHVSVPVHLTDPKAFVKVRHLENEVILDEDPARTAKLNRMAAVALLMAVLWITQAIPIPATALLPLALFPLLGLVDSKTLAPIYMNDNIFLFVGGFLIAIALERWQLARRIALTIVLAFGSSPRRLVLGFMVATAFLSMWISNTATTMMMFPIGLSVILLAKELGREPGGEKAEGVGRAVSLGAFPAALMLSIAYAANIGGIATKIGTPPNIVFFQFFQDHFSGAPQPTFTAWMMLSLPFVAVFLVVSWLVLTRVVFRFKRLNIGAGRSFIRDELRKMGPMTASEWQVLVVFAITALLWITRGQIEEIGFPGWVRGLGLVRQEGDKIIELVCDGGVSITMALTLFLLPSRKKTGERLLDAGAFQKVPWGIVLLFGGGFALAKGMESSGLSVWLGTQLQPLGGAWPPAIIACVSGMLTFLTELTSNTATTNMVLPVLKGVSVGADINPMLLMIPATISASCAFMLPVATPPNAIVFGSGHIPLGKMIRAGLIMNFIGILLVTILILTLGVAVFNIGSGVPEGWLTP